MDTQTLFKIPRNSAVEYGEIYFWTNTIKDWSHLLKQDKYKIQIITSLKKLVDKKMIAVYGFVIMPNHIHLIWELLKPNGKEKPNGSFNKETAHLILKDLKLYHKKVLPFFAVNEKERKHRIWQRDPLAIPIFTTEVLLQKLNYIHNNPLQERWQLAQTPEEYIWSSAKFYNTFEDEYGILTHFKERLG
ncbi:MAG: transposase [Bacteroidetes bacterium]|nr:transposase [Bacteroidota bacterium]